MKWEDAKIVVEEIRKAKKRQSDNDKEVLESAQRHIDQRRNLSKDAELFIMNVYRKVYGGGQYENRIII